MIENKNKSVGFVVALVVAIAELGGMGLLYMQNRALQEQTDTLLASSVLKHELTFEMLPDYIQKNYRPSTRSLSSKVAEGSKESIANVNVLDFSQSEQLVLNNSKLMLLGQMSCDDMEKGSYEITYDCQSKLRGFLLSFEKEYVYEVTSLTQADDLADFNMVMKALTNASMKELQKSKLANNFTKFTKDGLGMSRIQQVVNQIAELFGENANILINPHQEFASKQSGFRLRVYNAL